jgi:ATP-dependent RNA helicase RhlE
VKTNDWKQVLVFCRTKHGANRLAQQLSRDGINADAIHGNKSQNARERALGEFKDGKLRVLVATDIAARGLDIEALPHVVNYDLPHVAEDYVHRIGRTGRAGAEGEAVSFVSAEERPLMAAIERLMNRKVESRAIAGFEPGSAGSRPAHPRPAPQQTRERPRHERRRGESRPQRGARPSQNRPARPWEDRSASRQRNERMRPERQPRAAMAPVNPEYQAQVEEARRRMREEGEQPAPRSSGSPRRAQAVPALFARKSELPDPE